MNFWNLIVVLCFAVLYVGLVMVFLQLKRMQDDFRIQNSPSRFPDLDQTPADPAPVDKGPPPISIQELRAELKDLKNSLLNAMDGFSDKLQPELDAIQRQIRYLDRTLSNHGSGSGISSVANASDPAADFRQDAYQEARFMLASGIDEDHVIEKTGLSVEEVSLLKRLLQERGNN